MANPSESPELNVTPRADVIRDFIEAGEGPLVSQAGELITSFTRNFGDFTEEQRDRLFHLVDVSLMGQSEYCRLTQAVAQIAEGRQYGGIKMLEVVGGDTYAEILEKFQALWYSFANDIEFYVYNAIHSLIGLPIAAPDVQMINACLVSLADPSEQKTFHADDFGQKVLIIRRKYETVEMVNADKLKQSIIDTFTGNSSAYTNTIDEFTNTFVDDLTVDEVQALQGVIDDVNLSRDTFNTKIAELIQARREKGVAGDTSSQSTPVVAPQKPAPIENQPTPSEVFENLDPQYTNDLRKRLDTFDRPGDKPYVVYARNDLEAFVKDFGDLNINQYRGLEAYLMFKNMYFFGESQYKNFSNLLGDMRKQLEESGKKTGGQTISNNPELSADLSAVEEGGSAPTQPAPAVVPQKPTPIENQSAQPEVFKNLDPQYTNRLLGILDTFDRPEDEPYATQARQDVDAFVEEFGNLYYKQFLYLKSYLDFKGTGTFDDFDQKRYEIFSKYLTEMREGILESRTKTKNQTVFADIELPDNLVAGRRGGPAPNLEQLKAAIKEEFGMNTGDFYPQIDMFVDKFGDLTDSELDEVQEPIVDSNVVEPDFLGRNLTFYLSLVLLKRMKKNEGVPSEEGSNLPVVITTHKQLLAPVAGEQVVLYPETYLGDVMKCLDSNLTTEDAVAAQKILTEELDEGQLLGDDRYIISDLVKSGSYTADNLRRLLKLIKRANHQENGKYTVARASSIGASLRHTLGVVQSFDMCEALYNLVEVSGDLTDDERHSLERHIGSSETAARWEPIFLKALDTIKNARAGISEPLEETATPVVSTASIAAPTEVVPVPPTVGGVENFGAHEAVATPNTDRLIHSLEAFSGSHVETAVNKIKEYTAKYSADLSDADVLSLEQCIAGITNFNFIVFNGLIKKLEAIELVTAEEHEKRQVGSTVVQPDLPPEPLELENHQETEDLPYYISLVVTRAIQISGFGQQIKADLRAFAAGYNGADVTAEESQELLKTLYSKKDFDQTDYDKFHILLEQIKRERAQFVTPDGGSSTPIQPNGAAIQGDNNNLPVPFVQQLEPQFSPVRPADLADQNIPGSDNGGVVVAVGDVVDNEELDQIEKHQLFLKSFEEQLQSQESVNPEIETVRSSIMVFLRKEPPKWSLVIGILSGLFNQQGIPEIIETLKAQSMLE